MSAASVASEWRAANERAQLHARDCNLVLEPVELGNPCARYATLTALSLDGQELQARVIVPTSEGAHPALLMFHDATRDVRGWHHMTRFVALGFSVLALQSRPGVRGVLVDEPLVVGDGLGVAMRVMGEEPQRLGRALDAATADVLRQTYLDALVLAHLAARVPGVDASRLVAWGEGLGAGLALVAGSLAGARGVCALNPMPAALDDACAELDVARIACGCACPVLLGTCMLDLQATPEAQDVLAQGLPQVRRLHYPRYAHERVNAFEDEVMAFLADLMRDPCP